MLASRDSFYDKSMNILRYETTPISLWEPLLMSKMAVHENEAEFKFKFILMKF